MLDKILVVGSDGLIGRALVARLHEFGASVVETTRRRESVDPSSGRILLDLADTELWRPKDSYRTAVICAAIGNYEECRSNPVNSRKVNVVGTLQVARALAEAGTKITYLSTNAVFDGNSPTRKVNDPLAPQSEYGRQKADVELQLAEFGDRVCILRLTKVFPKQPPLLTGWVSSMRNDETIHPFFDLSCAPVSLDQVTEVLVRLVTYHNAAGIWHLAGDRDLSYAAVARYLADRYELSAQLIQPISVKATPYYSEHIPRYTSLECSRIRDELGIETGDVWRTLDALMEDP